MKKESHVIVSLDGRYYSYYRADLQLPTGWEVSDLTQREAAEKGLVYDPFPGYKVRIAEAL